MESKLFDLTGHTLEEIFPPQIRNKQFLNRQKKVEAVVEMPVEQLAAMGAVPQLLPAPDELLFEEDRRAVLEHVINELRPREAKVLRMRFGLAPYDEEHILDDVAAEMGVTRERCRQMEIMALNRLRHPAKLRDLKPLQHY
ncbi:MAG TPA: sigma factor-like helix-turn-helix DNA-binding protein [Pyrinomonadaceae bacterium]